MNTVPVKFGVGQPVPRTEDPRLLTGVGRYTDDYQPPRLTHAFVVRSPHAHARIRGIDKTAAEAAPGVVAVLTGRDYQADGLGGIKTQFHFPPFMKTKQFETERPALAPEIARHVGDPVALVVAETLAQARDAAELLDIDYEVLPAAAETATAMEDGTPQVWPGADKNLCFDFRQGDQEGAEKALAAADKVVKLQIYNNRITTNTMEPRAAVGEVDRIGRLVLYSGTQGVHPLREQLAEDIFHVPQSEVRALCDDVGGGFGMRGALFTEQILVVWAAKRTGRPVKWVADRSEGFISDSHARDNVTEAELALKSDGTFLGLRVTTIANMGSYLSHVSGLVPTLGVGMLAGLYTTPSIFVRVFGVFTHTLPTDPYRGAGRPEATYVIERLVDRAAAELGMDPVEIRRKNLIPPDKMPYQTFAFTYDSGDFPVLMEKALEIADVKGFAARQAESKKSGKLRGLGIANYIERCGAAGSEFAQVRLDHSGSVAIMMGTLSHGQGHETSFAQMVSDQLGVPFEKIRLLQGDTDVVSSGRGTYGSRSMAVGGSALRIACERVIEKGKKIAGHLLEAAPEDIEFSAGTFTVKGTDKTVGIDQVAKAAYPHMGPPLAFEPGLDEQAHYDPPGMTFPNGCHICEVEVDPDTGRVALAKYAVIDDVGLVINPLLLEGQIHGGIVQGAGQAMMENIVYDGDGQLVSGSFMDYCMPRADDFPSITVGTSNTMAQNNLLGVKGAGEAGTVGALPAVINGIVNALAPLGVRDVAMPATPETVWKAIRNAA